jgi:hypothetical protein
MVISLIVDHVPQNVVGRNSSSFRWLAACSRLCVC